MPKYRYITSGALTPNSQLCFFRLVGSSNMGTQLQAARIRVDDIQLDKLSCDSYSTTDDPRTLEEVGYDLMLRINGRLTVRNELKPKDPDCTVFPGFLSLIEHGYTGSIIKRGKTEVPTYKKASSLS